MSYPESVRRAGFDGDGLELGEALFDAILASPSGVVFTVDEYDETWRRARARPTAASTSSIPELLDELAALRDEPAPARDPEFPFVLSAGERRSFTANTIFRDPAWRKKDADGALRMNPADADARSASTDGGRVRVDDASAAASRRRSRSPTRCSPAT